MTRFVRGSLIWWTLLALVMVPLSAEETVPPVVVGYYPCWTDKLPVRQINFGRFTHLIHAFVTLRKGALQMSGNLPSRELTQAGHAAGVKVLLGLGGEDSGPELAAMTANPAVEEACIAGLAKLVKENGYDGVDVDWEFPTAQDVPQVVSLVDRLRQALRRDNPEALVTMPLPNTDYYGKYFDGPGLARLLDFAFIMTYNAHGPWKVDATSYCHAGFDFPLNATKSDPIDGGDYSFQKSTDYWRGKGFSNRQLVLGIHFSGHGFMVKQWGETPLQPSRHTDIDYRGVQGLIAEGWRRHWDGEGGVPWLESPAGLPAELITYDDAESVALKGKWVREAGLRGIFFWEITEDLIQGHNVLVEEARKGLGAESSK